MKEYTKLEKVTYEVYTYDEIVEMFNTTPANKMTYLDLEFIHITMDELWRDETGRICFNDWNTEKSDWEEIELKQGQYLVVKNDTMYVYDNLYMFKELNIDEEG